MRKTTSNIFYNAIYQLFIIIVPFITMPYVARVLGKEALGINSYVNSIPIFLSFIILMGMNQVGVRVIAQSSEDELETNFKQLWGLQLVSGVIVITLYLMAVALFLNYKTYFLIEIPFLIGYVLDISWFYIGRGQVKTVVIRNTLIKLILIATIFLFVHSSNDLWIYLLINSITYLANFVFWIGLRSEMPKFNPFKFNFSLRYLKESITITIPAIAAQFYTSFDQTIIGILAGAIQLTYYSQTQTIARAVIQLLSSVTIILMPIMAKMDKTESNQEKSKQLLKASLDYTLIIGLFLAAALMVNSNKFIVWFFGAKYAPMTQNFFWVSLLVIIIPYGGVYANQFALAKGMYQVIAIPYIIGAIFSVAGNLIFASQYGAIGGTVVIVLTELLVCLLRMWLVRKAINLKEMAQGHWKYWTIFFLSVIVGLNISINTNSLFVDLVLQTISITLIFLILLLIFKTRIIDDLKRVLKNKKID